MGKLYLKNGKELELTDDQHIFVAKWLLLYPYDVPMRVAGETFSVNDIDIEKAKKMRLPQQTGLGIEVETVENKVEKRME